MRSLWLAALFCAILPAATPPRLQLGDEIRPLRYAAELTLVTGAAGFDGAIDIDLRLARPAPLIWLNAVEITIHRATISAAGKTQTGAVEPGDADFTGLRFPADVPAGQAKLHVEYHASISTKDTAGVFQGHDGNETYLFTQFESIDARRAFPCFDQPDIKVPWQLTLHVRRGDTAISNTLPRSEREEPNGMKRVAFAPTRPLSSYLVAFAVGPFDVVDAGRAGRNRIPIRIIAPKGKASQAKYAAEVTATIMQRLEDYFGVPFPYEKSDQVAVPLTFGFGAMENAGMVTYGQTILLADPASDTVARQRNYASTAAHELAHQWFGDLVTTAWWNDIWLNEAFATWMSYKILAEWKPEWNSRLGGLESKFSAMGDDSLTAARQIRQPIESKDDISNAFDGITYGKGAAVIRMFENWVGEQRFQAGVTAYLKRYADRNARAGDFLDSVASASEPQLPGAFSSFLEQPGFPEISVALKCAAGGSEAAPRVTLSQKRYLPIGSSGGQNQTWRTPVCVRYPAASDAQTECFLLDRASAEFPLSKTASCPASISANADGSGYYVARYEGDMLGKLLAGGSLNPAEQMTVLHDIGALADAGDAPQSQALEAAAALAGSGERRLNGMARSVVSSTRHLLPDSLLPNYARFVRRLFGPRAAELGWTRGSGDDDETRLFRVELVPFAAVQGEDRALLAEARRLANAWLAGRQSLDPELRRAVLTTAANAGDQDLFDALLRKFRQTEDRQQRQAILAALSSFRDPKIAAGFLDLFLKPDFDMKEIFYNIFGPLAYRETRKLPFEFVKAHYDALVQRLPTGAGFDGRAMLPLLGQSFCDEPARREFVSYFQDRVRDWTGGPRTYAQVLEGMRLCEAQKTAQGQDVGGFFAGQ
jgi:alanyl aminopeptidase